jgi:hypothetical protein
MKKRMNRIAVALWVAAAVYFIVKLATLAFAGSIAQHFAASTLSGQAAAPYAEVFGHVLDALRAVDTITAAILGAGQLAGLGAIVEILDRIRRQNSSPQSN